ncbi:MAG: hypothetical protein L0191_07605, partial [Acidobacteria bacterium]|nr:hypothetical protein [Acidobacteriota bacterium]
MRGESPVISFSCPVPSPRGDPPGGGSRDVSPFQKIPRAQCMSREERRASGRGVGGFSVKQRHGHQGGLESRQLVPLQET